VLRNQGSSVVGHYVILEDGFRSLVLTTRDATATPPTRSIGTAKSATSTPTRALAAGDVVRGALTGPTPSLALSQFAGYPLKSTCLRFSATGPSRPERPQEDDHSKQNAYGPLNLEYTMRPARIPVRWRLKGRPNRKQTDGAQEHAPPSRRHAAVSGTGAIPSTGIETETVPHLSTLMPRTARSCR
jgi:hypothetical protein